MFAVLFDDQEMMLINPKIMSHSLNMIYLPEGEGCLSVNRPVLVLYRDTNALKLKLTTSMDMKSLFSYRAMGLSLYNMKSIV